VLGAIGHPGDIVERLRPAVIELCDHGSVSPASAADAPLAAASSIIRLSPAMKAAFEQAFYGPVIWRDCFRCRDRFQLKEDLFLRDRLRWFTRPTRSDHKPHAASSPQRQQIVFRLMEKFAAKSCDRTRRCRMRSRWAAGCLERWPNGAGRKRDQGIAERDAIRAIAMSGSLSPSLKRLCSNATAGARFVTVFGGSETAIQPATVKMSLRANGLWAGQ